MKSSTLYALVLGAATLGLVSAQSSATTGASLMSSNNLSSCVINCITQEASKNGCSTQDIKCLCTNTVFQTDVLSCLNQKCTPSEIQAAAAFESAVCHGSGTSTVAGTGTGASTSPTTALHTSAAGTAASSAASSVVTTSTSTPSPSAASSTSTSFAVISQTTASISVATSAATATASTFRSASSAAESAASSAATSTSSNAASKVNLQGGMVGMGIAFIGMVAGAVLVL